MEGNKFAVLLPRVAGLVYPTDQVLVMASLFLRVIVLVLV